MLHTTILLGLQRRFYSVTIQKDLKHYDCIIAGGGMIGTALACSLGASSLLKGSKILLIEAGKKRKWSLKPNFSNRVSAINKSSKKLLDKLGVWANIESLRYHNVQGIKVWGCCSPNSTKFAENIGNDIAYIVENDIIVNEGYNMLEMKENVDILYDSQVTEITSPKHNYGDPPQIKLKDGSVFSCNLLVGADGINSRVRASMNTHNLSWSYNQSAIVATLNILTENQENCIAWQRFLPDGPIALLPLSKTQSSLVWSTTQRKAKYLMELPEEEFVDCINEALARQPSSSNLVDFTSRTLNMVLNALNFDTSDDIIFPPFIKSVQTNSRASFPLGFSHCSKYVAPRLALIGDAAHRVHPLAGQGVNLGFSDVKYLSEALEEGIRQGRPFGDIYDLISYEKNCQWHNVPIMMGIDLLYRIYSSQSTFIKAVGDISFKLAETIEPINNGMKRFASGSL